MTLRRRCARKTPRRTAAIGLALTLAIALTGGDGHAQDDDPWFGRDKALHFSFSAALAGGGYGGAALLTQTDERRWRVVAGAGLAMTAGIGKELYDLSGRGDASLRDLTWDVIGTATGLLVAWTIDRLLCQPARQGAGAP